MSTVRLTPRPGSEQPPLPAVAPKARPTSSRPSEKDSPLPAGKAEEWRSVRLVEPSKMGPEAVNRLRTKLEFLKGKVKPLTAPEVKGDKGDLPGQCEFGESDTEGETIDMDAELKLVHFQEKLTAFLDQRKPVSAMGAWVVANLTELPTAFGTFWKKVDSASPSGAEPHYLSSELLPIRPSAIDRRHFRMTEDELGWVQLMVHALNFYYCVGYGTVVCVEAAQKLHPRQEECVLRLLEAVRHFVADAGSTVPVSVSRLSLLSKTYDYEGNPLVKMQDLSSDAVTACWPDPGKAAVRPIVDFLKGETKEIMLNPARCIKPREAWPKETRKSYVRATDEEWRRICRAAHKRGMMRPVDESRIFRGVDGQPVYNGAGGVSKMKKGLELQRFISILCPINEYLQKIPGAEETLPYVGQVCLASIGPGEEMVLDSLDLESCFNLFKVEDAWLGYFAYEKKVDGAVFDLTPGVMVRPALAVVPMGWISAVGVIQEAIRYVAFDKALLKSEEEVTKLVDLPERNQILLYLDSMDYLRRVSKSFAHLVEGKPSASAKAFEKACGDLGLPLNSSKTLASALMGTLQGGELFSREGKFSASHEKLHGMVSLSACLVASCEWKENMLRAWTGKACFQSAFRRPLYSIMEEVFLEIERLEKKDATPSWRSIDEVLSFMALLPLAFTNLRAQLSNEIAATDASETGCGTCVAWEFKAHQARDVTGQKRPRCSHCGSELPEDEARGSRGLDCSARCGTRVCSLGCLLEHNKGCATVTGTVKRWAERFGAFSAPISTALAARGLPIQEPFGPNWKIGDGLNSEQGRERLAGLEAAADCYGEVWYPALDLMSRARGSPLQRPGCSWNKSGEETADIKVRDEMHVMGFNWLDTGLKYRLRQSNKVALRMIKRCKTLLEQEKVFVMIQPLKTWLWFFKEAAELQKHPEVNIAVASLCCFGGPCECWVQIATNTFEVWRNLHKPRCECSKKDSPAEAEYEGGHWRFRTEAQLELPDGFVNVLADGLLEHMLMHGEHDPGEPFEGNKAWIDGELEKAGKRFSLEARRKRAVDKISQLEEEMQPGLEAMHLARMVRRAHYRGTDVRLMAREPDEVGEDSLVADPLKEVPYPAYRWLWREQLSFAWKHEQHINILEVAAAFAHLRRKSRGPEGHALRQLIVLDSKVAANVMAKGRSSPRRLNRMCRRIMALVLAADLYPLVLWTISRWNYADRPSRAKKKQN